MPRRAIALLPSRRSSLGLLAGALFALSTRPVDFGPAIFLALAALAALIFRAGSTREAGKVGFFFGAGANLVILRFVVPVIARFTPLPAPCGILALVLLAAFQGIPWAAAAALGRALAGTFALPRPVAFAIGVYFACFLPGLFPWSPAGALGGWPVWIQSASLVGDRGASLLVAGLSGMIAVVVLDRSVRLGLATAALGALLFLSGRLAIERTERVRDQAAVVRVGLVMPGVGATTRWEEEHAPAIVDLLRGLTLHSEHDGAELTVWPEASYPYVIHQGTRTMPRSNARSPLGGGVQGPLLFGAITREPDGIKENSAYVLDSSGKLSPPQHKIHLLWFGEVVPFADSLPFLRKTFGRGLGMRAGEKVFPLESGRIRAAVLNCYEDTLTASSVDAARVNPNLLVNVTNDAWFVDTEEGWLHERLSVLRAIELRRDLVRAVNLGVTTHIDAAGTIVFRYAGKEPAAPVVSPVLLDEPTVFARLGDWPLLVLMIGALAVRIVPRVRDRHKTRTA